MKENEKSPMVEITEQTMKQFEQAFRMGLKAQEDAGKYLTSMCNIPAYGDEKQNPAAKMTAMIDSVLPTTQKQVEELLNLIGKSTQTTAELVRKAAEAARASTGPEGQAKWTEVSKLFFQGVRSNADSLMQMNARVVDSWMEIMNKNIKIPTMKA